MVRSSASAPARAGRIKAKSAPATARTHHLLPLFIPYCSLRWICRNAPLDNRLSATYANAMNATLCPIISITGIIRIASGRFGAAYA